MNRDIAVAILSPHQGEFIGFGVRRLALFGSVARGTAGPNSDVDMLVEFAGKPTIDQYRELSFYLEALLNRPVGLVTAGSLRDFMRESVERDALRCGCFR